VRGHPGLQMRLILRRTILSEGVPGHVCNYVPQLGNGYNASHEKVCITNHNDDKMNMMITLFLGHYGRYQPLAIPILRQSVKKWKQHCPKCTPLPPSLTNVRTTPLIRPGLTASSGEAPTSVYHAPLVPTKKCRFKSHKRPEG